MTVTAWLFDNHQPKLVFYLLSFFRWDSSKLWLSHDSFTWSSSNSDWAASTWTTALFTTL